MSSPSDKPKEYRQARFTRPAGATEVLLIRHGESRAATPDNPFPLVDGHGDPELHPNGREQAERVAERLREEPIAHMYVSNLRRTSETAAPLAAQMGIQPQIDPDLREICLGDWEGGLLRIKAAENDPVWQRVHQEERWDIIPNAESAQVFAARLQAALDRIAAAHPDQLIAAFVHGAVIGQILSMATGARGFAFHGADNGSISHIVLTEGRILLRRFNDSSHLRRAISAPTAQMT